MLVSVIAGSDKTVVSVATGHQEFHLVYVGPGNIDNPTCCTHGIGFLSCAFLPIPKGAVSHSIFRRQLPKLTSIQASESERKSVAFQQFCRQLYHSCLNYIYLPLRPAMMMLEVVKCPDRHYHQCIFSIGPYIADYPKQVLLACIVNNWCPK
jgi:hypothetical protein